MHTKQCSRCQTTKTVDEFTRRSRSADGLNAACKTCTREASRRHYARDSEPYKARVSLSNSKRRSEFSSLIESAKNVPCVDCGQSYPPCVMDFDHVRGEKLFNVSKGSSFSKTAVHREIAKCEVVCANCHRIRTHLQVGSLTE